MNIIQLPAVLPGDLDLAEINQQLKKGTAELDWSSVLSVKEEDLAILLNGFSDLDSEVIDSENCTMSDNIAQKVVDFFNNHQNIENNHPSILEIPSYYQIRAKLEKAI